MDELIDKVIEQIIEDVWYYDYTAISELLENMPVKHLEAFLSEERKNENKH